MFLFLFVSTGWFLFYFLLATDPLHAMPATCRNGKRVSERQQNGHGATKAMEDETFKRHIHIFLNSSLFSAFYIFVYCQHFTITYSAMAVPALQVS